MVPGADIHQHHDDHIEIRETRIERRRIWSTLKAQALGGLMMAIASAMIGIVAYASVMFIRGGGK
jgi:hypothetical protein